MIIGVPKEIAVRGGLEEKRVSLSPAAVNDLTAVGLQVIVESGAGDGAHFSDQEYRNAGAVVVYSKEEAYRRADVVVKVQVPTEDEWGFLREEQILLGYLFLGISPKPLLNTLLEKRLTAIGMELVEREDGTHPLQRPMSKIAGKMAPQIAGRLLQGNVKQGRGILLGGIEGIPPAEVVILGAGTLGTSAARSFAGLGCSVYVVDKEVRQLERLANETTGVVTIIHHRQNLAKLATFADVLVAAVQVPGEKAPVLVDREMVKSMRKGSVVLDFSIDQGGAVATSRLTPNENDAFTLDGIIHFGVPNVPSWVPRTSSHALASVLLPYLVSLGKNGTADTFRAYPELRKGVCTYDGYTTRSHLSSEGNTYQRIEELLEVR